MSASLIFDTEALTSVTFDENPLLRNSLIKINKVVSPAGIEPATYALGGRRAIQLCHGDFFINQQADLCDVVQTGDYTEYPTKYA